MTSETQEFSAGIPSSHSSVETPAAVLFTINLRPDRLRTTRLTIGVSLAMKSKELF